MQKEENSQAETKIKKNQGERKQEKNKEDKIDSIAVARQLIEANQQTLGKWLLQFKKLKNPNFQKFQDKILDYLHYLKVSLEISINRFIAISFAANQQNTTGNQMTHIFKGFIRYWKNLQFSLQIFEELFNHYYQLYRPICKLFANYCRELIEKKFDDRFQHFEKLALQMLSQFIKSNHKGDQQKALALIFQFNLYNEVDTQTIIDILVNQQNIKDIAYAFTDHEGNLRSKLFQSFVDRCIMYDDKNEMAKIEKLIKQLNLNHKNYPRYIWKLHQRYIRYQFQKFKLFQIELAIQHDIQLIRALIEELNHHKRYREMDYFIVKYNLQQQYNYKFEQKQRQQLLRIKNVLLQCDQFGPTEIEVLEQRQQSIKYLYMKDFGIKQDRVVVIDNKNIKQINIKQQFALLKVGIDSQRAGGTHVFDPSDTEIVQIYSGKRVLVFDYKDLKKNQFFKEIITYLFTHCKICGQDIKKEMTQFKEQLQLQIQEKLMQQLMKNRIYDVGKQFQRVFPKEKKSNLAFICEVVFNKKLSKYEQCSGWKNRPLRKAQLHYAALDCVVPYKLQQQLSK